jgi:carbon monoxide dehydrogenase subunit G
MVVKILVAVLAVVAVATRPAEFHIERSIAVAAPADKVFALVNDLHAWAAWSPWEKLDPNMERTHSGAAAGVGATYAWKSQNGKVGEGRMTIEKSASPSQVGIELQFIKPFAATNQITFTLVPSGGGTQVTWAMDGRNGFMAKAFGLVMNMDKMVGGDFERGLDTLKTVAETDARAASPIAAGATAGSK